MVEGQIIGVCQAVGKGRDLARNTQSSRVPFSAAVESAEAGKGRFYFTQIHRVLGNSLDLY